MPSSLLLQRFLRGRVARTLTLCALALLLSFVFLPRGSHAGGQDAAGAHNAKQGVRAEFVPGEVLVRFRSETAAKQAASLTLSTESGTALPLRIERLAATDVVAGLRLARVAPAETLQAVAALNARADVLYAEPNYLRHKSATPNDTRYGELWGLKNTGQANGTTGADMRAEQAWDTTTGSNSVVVAVIDEGIDVNHQDLQPNVWRNAAEANGAPGVDDDGNGYVDDVNGFDFFHNDASVYDGPGTNPDGSRVDEHGTHVAGTIGARGNNNIGITGVNWQVSLMSLKFLGPDGGSTADLVRALAYAKWMRERFVTTGGAQGANVRVTNNSYGGGGYSQAEVDAINALNDAGILFVAAAGNEGEDNTIVPSYPATYDLPNIISVAALDRRNNLAGFSNRGLRTAHLGAPGVEVLSTTPGNTYSYLDGTSMASPHVAGAAALVLAAHQDFTVARLRAALLFGGEPTQTLDGTTITGRRVSAAGALANATEVDSTPPAAPGDLHITSQLERTVALAWTATGDDGSTGRAALAEVFFTDGAMGARFPLAIQRPAGAGTLQTVAVNIPFRHTTGTLNLRMTDNAGNTAGANVSVADAPAAADPYSVTTDAPAALSTGGAGLNMQFDDFITSYQLPFNFPFFERYASSVYISTNGALYFGTAPHDDPFSLMQALGGRNMIAGLWDDLDLRASRRADSGVFVVQPDQNRLIFRWQGVTFADGTPVNFEIELRRDGTIIERYGDGNTNVAPVVGIGGGEPEPYIIGTHTAAAAPINLTNAGVVSYTLRRLPKKADLKVTVTDRPNPVLAGQNITYTVRVTNNGPDAAAGVKVIDTLPIASTNVVSCTTSQGACAGAEPGRTGTLTANLETIASGASATATIVVTTTSAFQSSYINVAAATAATYEPTTFDNSYTSSTQGALTHQNPLTGVDSISAGGGHTLALTPGGEVLAWGRNTYGGLGDGTTTDRGNPGYVRNLSGVRGVAGGGGFSLAVKSNGTVMAWGANYAGQLGDGTTTQRLTPVQVSGLSNVVAVAAGGGHSVALKSDGTVWAWGLNLIGQLGDGTTTQRLTPVQINGITGVQAISASVSNTIALKTDGTVWTWGDGAAGQLGYNSPMQTTPTRVLSLSGIRAVASGSSFSLFLRTDGSLLACGANAVGQLGDGTNANRTTPVPVLNLTNIVAISAGDGHSLALSGDGTVWAWGANNSNQLGEGSIIPQVYYETTPVQVIIVANARAIAAGGSQSAAIRQDGPVLSWGDVISSRGYPYGVDNVAPRPTLGAPTFSPDGGAYAGPQNVTITLPGTNVSVAALAPGTTHTLALMSDGTVQAWGQNDGSQLGSNTSPARFSLTPLPVANISGVQTLAAGPVHSVALKPDGTVWAWGADWYGAAGHQTITPEQIAGFNDAADIAAGGSHTLVRRNDGTIWAWGANTYGQIGDGSTFDRTAPVRVGSLTGMTAFAAGPTHNLAVKNDGTVWAWGANLLGQIGDGTFVNRSTPVRLTTLTNMTAVAAGINYSVALRNDGTVWAWGSNQYGLRGDGTTNGSQTPVQVSGVSNVVAIAARKYDIYALRNDGTVWAWGNSPGMSSFASTTPVQIAGLSGINQLLSGGEFLIARKTDGTFLIVGSNSNGVFGNGTNLGASSPVPMSWLGSGITLHYTTDGNEPTETDPVINSGATVLVNQTTTLKARAFKDGFAPGGIKAANYTLGGNQANSTVQFSSATYNAAEEAGHALITLTRTGDTSGAASVSFNTVDDPAEVRCDDTTTMPGVAFARCDYATTVDTITFAPNATQATINVPLINDGHVENNETVQLRLTSGSGATLGAQTTATLTITDNDTTATPNPVFDSAFFVRQQYLDFLSREPDASGYNAWFNLLNGCQNVNNTDPNSSSAGCDRINVSNSFFGSQEFQLKGLYVFKFYKVAFNRLPQYAEIIADMRGVTGQTAEEVYAKRATFAANFTQRTEFITQYPTAMTNDAFVNALLGRYNLTSIYTPDPAAPDGTQFITLTAGELAARLAAGTLTRAQVLRAVVQSNEVSNREFNNAFVAMQYYGYLRRAPETAGYNSWLNYLTAHPTDARTMVNGFMNSPEYRLRFGKVQ